MGRGYVFGLLVGVVASAAGLAGVSLMAPVAAPVVAPEVATEAPAAAMPTATTPARDGADTGGAAPAGAAGPSDAVASAADTAPAATPAAEPVAEPEATPAATPATAPAAAIVEVPAGSEFNRPKPETDPVIPGAEAEPVTAALPSVSVPQAESAPVQTDAGPAAIPETAPVPTAPAAPEPAAPPAVASLPAADESVPVPPPGEVAAPELSTGAPAEAPLPQILAEAPAAPAAEPSAEPAAPAESAPVPDVLPAFEDDAPAPPDEGLPGADLPDADLPGGEAPAEGGGPVMIGVAPSPFGAADAPKPGFGQKIQPGFGQKIQPGFGQAGSGVRVIRPPSSNAPEAAPEAAPDAVAAGDDSALRRYAAAFEDSGTRPLVAVVLMDLGEDHGGVAPERLAEIGAPVTVAIDPEAADAGARASTYRLSGDEIAILAPDLPEGAAASDLEVSYQAAVSTLPEAVAMVGRASSRFQTDRRIAQHLVALLATEGRGLVTYTRGLDPARQAAEGEGLPHAAVFRDLDAGGETPASIQRLLDRAAFEAARIGTVVVIGTTSPETVSALQDWIAAGAKGAAVGPVSAAMLGTR